MNRVVWDMRHQLGDGDDGGGEGAGPPGPGARRRGPLVVPGTYTARLEVAGQDGVASDLAQQFVVREDPRINASPGVRAAWTATLLELADALARADAESAAVNEALQDIADDDTGPRATSLRDLAREFGELASRIGRLAGDVEGVVAPLTQDQRSRRDFYMEMLEVLSGEAEEAVANP